MRIFGVVLLISILTSGCAVNIRAKVLAASRAADTFFAATNIRQLDSGNQHTCFHDSDGSLKCWGDNSKAQIQPQPNWNPAVVPSLTVSSSTTEQVIALGRYHTCVVTDTGALKCFGANVFGQSGDPTMPTYVYTPNTVIPSGVTRVAAELDLTCAIVNAGELQCFGRNDIVNYGANPNTIFASGTSDVSAAQQQTCAVVSGALYCWGVGTYGGLGDGAVASYRGTPYQVFAAGVTDVSVGDLHACAIQAGALKCWGWNAYGQIGNGTTGGNVLAHYTVFATGVTSVSAVGTRTCAVVSGSTYCWGATGIDGVGTVNTPTLVTFPGLADTASACSIVSGALKCWGNNDASAIYYFGLLPGAHQGEVLSSSPLTIFSSGVTSISTFMHACAAVSGQLYCWGSNDYGQVGNSSIGKLLSAPVTVFSSGVATFATGAEHTCVTISGALRCFGSNDQGQIGNGSTSLLVGSPYTAISAGVTQVVAGSSHTCALVSGAVQCFGDNTYGQIGNGTGTGQITTPYTAIPSGVTKIYGTGMTTCALKTDHTLWCFGYLSPNFLNDGNLTPSGLSPVQLTLPPGDLVDFSMSYAHACAIMEASGTRSLYCWGDNTFGQIVDDSINADGYSAQVLVTSATLETVSLGYFRTCYTDGGVLKCRGQNDYGEIDISTPGPWALTPVTLATGATLATCRGVYHSCALVGNDVKCWGYNEWQVLGSSVANQTYGTATLMTSVGP